MHSTLALVRQKHVIDIYHVSIKHLEQTCPSQCCLLRAENAFEGSVGLSAISEPLLVCGLANVHPVFIVLSVPLYWSP